MQLIVNMASACLELKVLLVMKHQQKGWSAMSAATKAKDKAMAAYLKSKGVKRTTTACPHHCGAHPQVGDGILRHMQVCRGAQRQTGPVRNRATRATRRRCDRGWAWRC